MSAYDEYLKMTKKYSEDNLDIIEETNRSDKESIFPQHILMAKTVSKHLEDDEAKTLRIDENFYFTENLVNKLMLFAFLKGRKDIDELSYRRGWKDCRDAVAKTLNFSDDTSDF